MKHGGGLVAEVLRRQGVEQIYTLCGGHISPILAGARERGIRVIDVRHEVNAVFAADATARLTGIPGVAAVTAGPGVTNSLTALQNARQAQSPLVLLGGAAPTILRGRGALQDVDQQAMIRPHVKWVGAAATVKELVPLLEEAFEQARSGVPGPVFVECPIDLLYPEEMVRDWYGKEASGHARGLVARAVAWYVRRYLDKLFGGADLAAPGGPVAPAASVPWGFTVGRAARRLAAAKRPVLIVGSQALCRAEAAEGVAEAVERLGIPTYLSGMARGLLGRDHPLHMQHKRRNALKEADLVILAGVPCDFRLGYGAALGRATLISANLHLGDLFRNRIPRVASWSDPGRFLCALAARAPAGEGRRKDWLKTLRDRCVEREREIDEMASADAPPVNPLALCRGIDRVMGDDAVIIGDGGDFVATASYTLRPRGPLGWLDPGVFGTLGVGAGFAMASAACCPESETWLLYGDGAAGFSMIEFDTFARHGLPVIAVVGNDAAWTQIARDQVTHLGDDVGTVLARTDYERVAEGLGGVGLRIDSEEEMEETLRRARELAAEGKPVLVNVHIGSTDFRKGSISM